MNRTVLDFSNSWARPAVIASVLFFTIAGAGASWWLTSAWPTGPDATGPAEDPNEERFLPKPEPQLYKPLLPEQAKMENDKLPFSTALIEKALPLALPSSELLPIGKRNATDCLTSAIYYEAGNEISQGKRAVAQVILNRVRHPTYPKTICGVVYQGAERKTGCQFTFTCDGSLARRPARDRWEQARIIAIGAMSGAVEPSVGTATHYHADYVVPYWASSLDKVSKVGAHIFYRWKGAWGKRRAFSQAVQLVDESLPSEAAALLISAPTDNLLVPEIPKKLTSQIMADDESSADSLLARAPQINDREVVPIREDQKRSTLIMDEEAILLESK